MVNRTILMNCYAEFLKNNHQNRQNGQNRQILQCFVGAGIEPPPHPENIDDSREEVGQGPRAPDAIHPSGARASPPGRRPPDL